MKSCFSPVEPGKIAIHPQYYLGRAMPCPDCGGTQWIVGRIVAQCARCETPLLLAASQHRSGMGIWP